MSEIQLDKKAYIKLIDEDIKWLEQQGSEHSLERKHIKAVLLWSISEIYRHEGTSANLNTHVDDIDTIGNCANCGVEFHIHKLTGEQQ